MVVSKNKLLIELINKQRADVDSAKKLDIKDLHRICKNLNGSVFASDNNCCLWCGYVTNISNSNTKYINFFFKKKKYALHRLLYENFIGDINKSEYLRFTCDNKGVCCNLNHIKKIGKDNKKSESEKSDVSEKEKDIVIEETSKKKTKKKSFKKNISTKEDSNNENSIEVIKSKNNLNKLIIIF